jgi:serine/threonine-protein kinase RsbW
LEKTVEQLISSIPDVTTQISMQVYGSSETLALIRRVIVACVQHLNLNATLLNDIKLATTEACTNVIKHAYKFDETRSFLLEIKTSSDKILIYVAYEDPEFIPDEIPVPNLKEIKEGGLGVFIIKNIMDEVIYETLPKSGKVQLCMVKALTNN